MEKETKLQLDRLVFFSDAVIAIAITLLALNLDIRSTTIQGKLSFRDLFHEWHKFAAFVLSFVLIALFWLIHHKFFRYIIRIDQKLLRFNLIWLFFIVLLPFSTTLASNYFGQPAAVFVYSINILLITIFQNTIWDYVSVRPDYLAPGTSPQVINDYRLACNVAMVNGLLAVGLSFIWPLLAFLVLFTRPGMKGLYEWMFRRKKKKSHSRHRQS